MFPSAHLRSRPAAPSTQEWIPDPFQIRMVEHLLQNQVATPWLDPGMGKTACVLAAFKALKDAGTAQKMLVVAPLRVCRLVWPQEVAKWTQFKDLRVELLHGPKKDAALKRDADIYLVNPEGVEWLAKKFEGRSLPFDTVLIDELTKFKNHSAKRHKVLRPRLSRVARRWGMTGTPAPNGYLDLFGQYLILDDGAALERFVTHYRDKYFMPDYNGFDYVMQPGADKRIEARIDPYVISMRADDYLTLPPLVSDPIEIELPAPARKLYNEMKRTLVSEMENGVVTAANAAACYAKMSQMANGAVYDEKGAVHRLHDEKLNALGDLLEQLQGRPLLLAYEFEHDLTRILERFPKTPWLGKGVSAKREEEIYAAWNRNEISLLLGHPASIGHGLNLQQGGASHVGWFSPIWDLELWDQFIKRLLRRGNDAERVINHVFIVKDSIDELKYAALCDKDATQSRLRLALNHAIVGHSTVSRHGGCTSEEPSKSEEKMVLKLSKQGASPAPSQPVMQQAAPAPQAQHVQQPEPQQAIRPAAWGNGAAPAETPDAQRAAAFAKITPAAEAPAPQEASQQDPAAAAKAAFAAAVSQQVASPAQAAETGPVDRQITASPEDRKPADEAPKKSRKKAADPVVGYGPSLEKREAMDRRHFRARSLELAGTLLKDVPDISIDDVLATAQQFTDFVYASA